MGGLWATSRGFVATDRPLRFRRPFLRSDFRCLNLVGVGGEEVALAWVNSFMIARWKRGFPSANFAMMARSVDSGTDARDDRKVILEDGGYLSSSEESMEGELGGYGDGQSKSGSEYLLMLESWRVVEKFKSNEDSVAHRSDANYEQRPKYGRVFRRVGSGDQKVVGRPEG